MRAIARETHVTARTPYIFADPFFRPIDDDAGVVTAGDARQSCLFHASGDVFHIAGIDGCRHHTDDGGRFRCFEIGTLHDFKLGGMTETTELNGSHGCSPFGK